MRMVKMQQETLTLEEAVQKFLMEKDAQHTGAAAMTDYRNCLARFVKSSHNSIEYDLLDADVLAFFSSIPDTSPARYNKPFQNVNAFLNWMVEQEYIPKSPILIEVLGTIAEQERANIRQRQAEGIEAAKQNGKKLGRPALTFPANWNEVYTSWKAGEITAKAAMEQTGTKRTSFYKLVGMMENKG